jgi:hypothetical protein
LEQPSCRHGGKISRFAFLEPRCRHRESNGVGMSLDNYVAIFSALVSFTGLLLVVLQLRDSNKQRQSESLVEIYDINRQLLSLGFEHPQLFAVLADDQHANPVFERRYLQLWLNHFSLINAYVNQSVLKGELKESLVSDLADFMTLKNAQQNWAKYGRYYPASFQALVNGFVQTKEPPPGGGGSNDV